MTQNTRNTNTLAQALETAIKECTNEVKFETLETLETIDLTEELTKARKEVERLESIIQECESAKAKAEAEAKREEEKQEKFLSSLTPAGREVLSYLEGMKTLATGDNIQLIDNIIRVFYKYNTGCEPTLIANVAAYVAILCKEEKYEQIRVLETVTLKIDQIQCNNKGTPDPKVNGLDRILLAIQDIY